MKRLETVKIKKIIYLIPQITLFQHQAFEFVKAKMADDSYTDLDRAELKQTVLETLLVGNS